MIHLQKKRRFFLLVKLCLRLNTFCTDAQEDEIGNYPQGLVLVQRGNDENSVVVGPHIRGSRLRASAAGFEEVDLLLPGTARLIFH